MNTYKKGRQYEQKACDYLTSKGYKILKRNYSPSRSSEIDIIALDGDWLVAVEVKGVNASWAQEYIYKKVNGLKIRKIARALEIFTASNPQYKYQRMDVLLLTGDKIIHYKDVR